VYNLNSILIEGVLAQDARCRPAPGGKVTGTLIVVNHGREAEESYFEVRVSGKLAEFAGERGHAGRGVRVVGKLKESRQVGADGENRSSVYIAAEYLRFSPEDPGKPAQKSGKRSTTGRKEV
jgi:single-strand DNA-binding protein